MTGGVPDRRRLGEAQGVVFEVAGWDSVDAEVDLSCACMFEREAGGQDLKGGLRHLDGVLKGALTALRAGGDFRCP